MCLHYVGLPWHLTCLDGGTMCKCVSACVYYLVESTQRGQTFTQPAQPWQHIQLSKSNWNKRKCFENFISLKKKTKTPKHYNRGSRGTWGKFVPFNSSAVIHRKITKMWFLGPNQKQITCSITLHQILLTFVDPANENANWTIQQHNKRYWLITFSIKQIPLEINKTHNFYMT